MFVARLLTLFATISLVTLACAPSTPAPAAKDLSPDAAAGQRLMTTKGCGGCHAVPGVAGASGTIGPNLAGVASRTTIAGGAVPNNGPQDLQRWILDPPAVKPGTAMPNLGLTDQDAQQIVAYLQTLR
jgi:cytochrome c